MKKLNLPKERTFVGPAQLWKRFVAFFIDILIIYYAVLFPFWKLIENSVPTDMSFSQTKDYVMANSEQLSHLKIVFFFMLALMGMYFYMMEKRMGQTIGKKLMKIHVVTDNDGKTWQYLVRNIVFLSVFPFILLWIIDPLFMIFTKTNQRLSEILSKTKVIERYSLEQNTVI